MKHLIVENLSEASNKKENLIMIAIVNITDKKELERNPLGKCIYSLRINSTEICKFEHKRSQPLYVCLEKAAKAAKEKELKDITEMILLYESYKKEI